MTDADPYSPPAAGSGLSRRRSPPSRVAIALASSSVFLLAVLLGISVGWELGAAIGEIRRPLAPSEEKADTYAFVHRLSGTASGLILGCGTGVGMVGMFYWYRARVLRKLTNALHHSPD